MASTWLIAAAGTVLRATLLPIHACQHLTTCHVLSVSKPLSGGIESWIGGVVAQCSSCSIIMMMLQFGEQFRAPPAVVADQFAAAIMQSSTSSRRSLFCHQPLLWTLLLSRLGVCVLQLQVAGRAQSTH